MPARYAGITWSIPVRVLREGVERGERQFLETLREEMQQAANWMLSYAQGNHPWTNRTGMAELTMDISLTHGGRRITLAYGVPYGIYLAYKHGGRWDVIRPTMEAGAPIVRQAMDNALVAGGFK